MTIRRMPIMWGGSADGMSVTYWDLNGSLSDTFDALNAFFSALEPLIADSMTYSVPSNGDTFDETTGELVGSWQHVTDITGSGSGLQTEVAQATQWYCRLLTDQVVSGRRLAGGMYVPGVTVEHMSGGEPTAGGLSDLAAAFEELIADEPNGLVIWHRPQGDPPSGGEFEQVSSVRPLTEFSTQRRRRRA